jgi:hypothetical protein
MYVQRVRGCEVREVRIVCDCTRSNEELASGGLPYIREKVPTPVYKELLVSDILGSA